MSALPYVAFFCSGASSLIFQALWTRMLHHTFGATSVAMSSVLTAFMAGLGLGAHLFGRRVRSFAHPLRVYALCELAVAACALLFPLLVEVDGPLASVNALLRRELGASSFSFMLARFACVLPLLLVPTTLMGGTLPLLAQHFVGDAEQSDSATAKVGALYAVNTFGAVAGSLLGSFVLMPAVGVRATNLVACGMNAALGVVILGFAGRGAAVRGPSPSTTTITITITITSEGGRGVGGARLRFLAAFAFACSGACAMAYEVVWSRALSMAIGSSLQAFALILVTFLVGIAGGSALLSSFMAEGKDGAQPVRVARTLGGSALLLCALALSPAWVLSNAALTWLAFGLSAALLLFQQESAVRELNTARALDPELASTLGS
ncbi:MAG TPA: hypothetical protein VFZ61_04305, partial [Polyangiales bacterium]